MGGDSPRLLRLANCANGAAMPHMARARALGFNRLFLSVDDLPEARGLQAGEGPMVCVAHGVHPDVQRQWALGRYQEDPLRRMKRRGELGDLQGRPIIWQNDGGRVVLDGGRPTLTATEFETMRWAHSYGVRTGVNTEACELGGRAVNVAFYSDRTADKIEGFEDAVAILFYLSHQIAHELRDCLTLQVRSAAVRLTPREAECLRWVAAGKNAQETALIMRLSVQTVRDHLKRVRAKLNSTTRAQALMRAAALGLLPAYH